MFAPLPLAQPADAAPGPGSRRRRLRALVLYAHPVDSSFHAAAHARALEALVAAGHEVDDCDLYAEGFEPVLSRAERLGYHDPAANQEPVRGYVERLRRAQALVFCFPVWCFGPPAILKGWFDRVMLPGVAFAIDGGTVTPSLRHVRAVAAITTYGRSRAAAWAMGDPPRKLITRYVRWFVDPKARVRYLALYHMNVADARARGRFLDRVGAELERL